MGTINVFYRRPLFLACVTFLLFSVIGYFLPGSFKLILLSAAILSAIAFVLLRFVIKKISPYVFLCAVLSVVMSITALCSSYLFFNVEAKAIEKYHNEYHSIEGVVISERYYGTNFSGFDIIVTEIDGKDTYHKATLSCQYTSVLTPGDKFEAEVYGSAFERASGSYNEKLAMYSDRVFINYLSENEFAVEVIDKNVFHPTIFFKDLNKRVSSVFEQKLDGQTADMCSAIFLGNRDALSNTVTRDFTRAGAAHILALSGMHMSIIMGFLMLVLMYLVIDRRIIAIVLSVCAVFYLLLTGFQISAARSVIMLLCVYASWLFKQSPDPLTSLMISATALMLISPGSVIDAAYWMSFAATLGILVYMQPFTEWMWSLLSPWHIPFSLKKWIIKLPTLIAVSVFAMIPLIIVLCIFIKQYSFYSIISSVVLSLPTSGIILISLLFLIFSNVGTLSGFLSDALRTLTEFMVGFCEKISDTENATVSLNYPFIIIIAVIMGIALMYSLIVNNKHKVVSLVPYAVAVIIFVSAISLYNGSGRDGINVTYVNASSQTDMLVLTDNIGNAVICDVGGGSKSSYYLALDALYSERATEIKSIVLTKYATIHSSSLYEMFTSEKVREVWVPYPDTQDDYYKMLFVSELAERYGVEVRVYEYGESLCVFENTTIAINNYHIDRSVRPISLVSVATDNDRLTYCSPAFNECDGRDDVYAEFEKSEFIIFGNAGPKSKTYYSIPNSDVTEVVAFSDDIRVSYFQGNVMNNAEYYRVSDVCRFRLEE